MGVSFVPHICVIGNIFVKYDARVCHILSESTNMKLEEQLKHAIRLKHFSPRGDGAAHPNKTALPA